MKYFSNSNTINVQEHWILKVISLSNNRIASCSEDKIIKIWNSNHPYNLIQTFRDDTYSIFSIIQLNGKEKLISWVRHFRVCNFLLISSAVIEIVYLN